MLVLSADYCAFNRSLGLIEIRAATSAPLRLTDDDLRALRNLVRAQVVTGGLFFAVAIWGVVDALRHYQSDVLISPTPGGLTVFNGAMYFSANAFLPEYLHYIGRADLVSAALTALNLGQIPASLLLLAVAGRLEHAIWPHIVCGAGSLGAIVGIMLLPGPGVVACAAVLGFFAAAILILMLALPPLLAPPDDVHRVSAAMFTISYTCAVIAPVFSGVAWDLTGIAQSAFVPLGTCAVLLMALAPGLRLPRAMR